MSESKDLSSEEHDDNIAPAMDAVAETLAPTRSRSTGAKKGETAQSQILIRATTEDHELIKQAAAALNISMSEFVRNTAVEKANELLNCAHPLSQRKSYPWAEICLRCGTRLRDGDGHSYKTNFIK